MLSRSWIKVLWQIMIRMSVVLNYFPKVKTLTSKILKIVVSI